MIVSDVLELPNDSIFKSPSQGTISQTLIPVQMPAIKRPDNNKDQKKKASTICNQH
jgi:hypothetical protein